MAIKRTNLMLYCPMCNIEKNSCDFYETINPHDGYMLTSQGNVARMGYTRLCKDDIYKCYLEYLKKGTMQSAVYFTCALTDTPFIKEVWERYIDLRKEKIKSGKITPNQLKTYNDFAKYREQLKAMKKATDDWIDFSATNVDYTEIMGLKKSDIALEAEKDKLILNWGVQKQMSDYDFLEKTFERYTHGVEFVNAQQEDLYRDLCRDRLSIRKINDGNYQGNETLEVIGKRVERIMSTLKVDEFESNKPKTISEQLMFSKIAQIEETKPADLYKEPNKYCDFNHYKEYDEKLIYRPLGNTLAGHRDFNISIDDIERYSQADAYSKCSKPSEGEEDGNN